MAALTIGEWIVRGERPVPEPLRRRLVADGSEAADGPAPGAGDVEADGPLAAAGPVAADALIQAAEREARACRAGRRRDREAAFGLLAADAYITYACLWLVQGGGGGEELKRVAGRVGGAVWGE